MKTYQDLVKEATTPDKTLKFVYDTINDYCNSSVYKMAVTAYDYERQRNTTIIDFQKLLYTVTGETVPDNYSANYKLCSNFFQRFITQLNQYLLGNGISWEKDTTKTRLGKDFDNKVQNAGYEALMCGASFCFWNLDHLEVFSMREFCPLFDEENGSLMAGIRFWQIDKTKPLRAVLFELDGYTEYIWDDRNSSKTGRVLKPKTAYTQIVEKNKVGDTTIRDGEAYPSFPVLPFYGNMNKQSELVGLRENIDCFDLIKSGYANTIDDASVIYWTIQNAGGMDEIDLAKFIDHMKRLKAAVMDDTGAHAEAHSMDIPYASREALLTRLRNEMYDDFMALDVKEIASGATTATQIRAAYEPINSKADKYEYCVTDFLQNLLKLLGIDDNPTYERSVIINKQEEIANVLQCAEYLPEEYVTRKLITIMGDIDQLEDIIEAKDEENMERMSMEYGDEEGMGESDDMTMTEDLLSQLESLLEEEGE